MIIVYSNTILLFFITFEAKDFSDNTSFPSIGGKFTAHGASSSIIVFSVIGITIEAP